MSLALLLIQRVLHFVIYLAAKPRLKTAYKHDVSRGGECTMANYVEARNSRKISTKSQTEQTDTSATDVSRWRTWWPAVVRNEAPTEPSATFKNRNVVTGLVRPRRRRNYPRNPLCSADTDYRFSCGR